MLITGPQQCRCSSLSFPLSVRTRHFPSTTLQSCSTYSCLHCTLLWYNLTWLWNLPVAWPTYCIWCKCDVFSLCCLSPDHSDLKWFVSSQTSTKPCGWHHSWSGVISSITLSSGLKFSINTDVLLWTQIIWKWQEWFVLFQGEQRHKQWERGLWWSDMWNICRWQMWPNPTVNPREKKEELMLLNNLTSVIYFLKKFWPACVSLVLRLHQNLTKKTILLGGLELYFSHWSVDVYIYIYESLW